MKQLFGSLALVAIMFFVVLFFASKDQERLQLSNYRGYEDGYAVGYEDGYTDGYEDALADYNIEP